VQNDARPAHTPLDRPQLTWPRALAAAPTRELFRRAIRGRFERFSRSAVGSAVGFLATAHRCARAGKSSARLADASGLQRGRIDAMFRGD